MSRYAWLVCEEEKEMIFLGKIVKDSETDSTYFHRGPGGTIKNSENQLFTKAIFKFFGTHIGKVIRVVPEEELERYTDASFVEIDGDPGPSLETYIEHFKGYYAVGTAGLLVHNVSLCDAEIDLRVQEVVTNNKTLDEILQPLIDEGVDRASLKKIIERTGKTPSDEILEALDLGRELWRLTEDGASRIMRHSTFGKFYKSKSDGLWWTVDNAGHGESAFKVFRERGKGLEWYRDVDEYGDFIEGKHKGPTGLFIPWKDLSSV